MVAEFAIDSREPAVISRFTGVPEPLVREFAGRLIENGIWLPGGKEPRKNDLSNYFLGRIV